MNMQFKSAIIRRAIGFAQHSPNIVGAGVCRSWNTNRHLSAWMFDVISQDISFWQSRTTLQTWRQVFQAFPDLYERFLAYFLHIAIWDFDLQHDDRRIACIAYAEAARDLGFLPSEWADLHDMPEDIREYLRV